MSTPIPTIPAMNTFLAFDTETATLQGGEICSIAAVLFEGGRVVDSFVSLVNPGVRIWWNFTANCHGISDAMVKDAPRFPEVWAQIAERFSAHPVVAHNMPFDRRALLGDLARAGLPAPAWRPHCTVKMAQHLWPTLPNHKLNTVAAHLGVPLDHHEALSDATACGHIAAKALEKWGGFPVFARS